MHFSLDAMGDFFFLISTFFDVLVSNSVYCVCSLLRVQ